MYIYMCVCVCVCVCIYIYIYREGSTTLQILRWIPTITRPLTGGPEQLMKARERQKDRKTET